MPTEDVEPEELTKEDKVRPFSYPLNPFSIPPVGTLTKVHPAVKNLLGPQNTPQGGGKIRHYLKQWESITSDQFVLKTVQGVEFNFLQKPVQSGKTKEYHLKPHEQQALDQKLNSMLQEGVIKAVNPVKHQFVSPIFVKEETDKYRPIVDFKRLNSNIEYEKFKMETLADVKDTLQQGDWMIKIDLKDAFLSVPLSPKIRKLARFSWRGILYECLTLMFGMAPAPRIFTKLMKVPMAVLRRLLIRLIIYIDDMLLMARTREQALEARDTAIYLLQSLGLTINWKKSILQPCQNLLYLGVIVNSMDMTFQVPENKISDLKNMCEQTLKTNKLNLRKLAKVMGKLRATAQAFSPAPLQLRNLQSLLRSKLNKSKSYDCWTKLDQGSRAELNWWIENLRTHNGKPVSMATPELIISSDSSSEGWGAFCQGQGASGKWNKEELPWHINVKELVATQKAILTFTRIHKVNSIHLLIDNTNALSYLTKMGGKTNQHMNDIAKQIWEYLLKNKIQCTAEYIPTELNVQADRESRTTDSSEWKLKELTFNEICSNFGQPDVDLFASLACHQLRKYISYKPDPEALAVDAFQQNWAHTFPYAFPPFNQIGRTLAKVRKQRSKMIIVTPTWQTQPYYPTLLQMAIQRPLLLPQDRDLLQDPAGNRHPLINQGKLRLAAWLVSGNPSKQKDFHNRQPSLSKTPDQKELKQIMSQPGKSLLAGVCNDKLIHFNLI